MNLTRDDAQKALESIQQVTLHTRRVIASGSAPYHMIVWGIVWFLGFLSDYFITGIDAGWIWILKLARP